MIEIRNRVIDASVEDILKDVRRGITNGKLNVIRKSGSTDLQVTCPFHNHGHERRPSCFIRVEDGVYHCFTCNEAGGLAKFVAACMDISEESAEEWLISRYGGEYTKRDIHIDYVDLEEKPEEEVVLDDSVLKTLESNHPYFKQRKISDEIVEKFELKYDPKTECVVFPVRDLRNRLIGLTKRKVKYKRYELPTFVNKPVYLLYYIVKENIKNVVVVESQINALYLWSLGIPAIALFGTGTTYQYDLLKRSGIKYYTLCFDGDSAGHKGAERFKAALGKYAYIEEIEMPDGTDINEYEPEVVKSLF